MDERKIQGLSVFFEGNWAWVNAHLFQDKFQMMKCFNELEKMGYEIKIYESDNGVLFRKKGKETWVMG